MASCYDDKPLRRKLGLSLVGKSSAGTKALGRVLERANPSQEKIVPTYADKDIVPCAGSVRSMSDKLTRQLRLENERYKGENPLAATVPSYLVNAPKTAKARPGSPFKKAKKPVVVVLKKAKA